jgi:hypothetical protein
MLNTLFIVFRLLMAFGRAVGNPLLGFSKRLWAGLRSTTQQLHTVLSPDRVNNDFSTDN